MASTRLLHCSILKAINLIVMISFSTLWVYGQDEEESIESIPELQAAIVQIMEETGTPGVGLALVDQNGPIWVAGLGKAKVEEDIDANERTLFRIGSVSKMFVSLSILKLQEAGKVKLTDKVRDLVPEIEFHNPWADTHPVLVAHLLEHTTGWDDLHLTEYAHSEPEPVSTKEGLDYHPHSRTSRWAPGSRMSYCNSGPPTAAYIVEKITGMPFEEYVGQTFFDPMGMESMTYFLNDDFLDRGASLYQGGVPQPYWHIIQRPSGSINASASDMAKMVQFFINRGRIDSTQVIGEVSLKRMETPKTTSAARAGMESGYGLSNYSTEQDQFVFRGHNGGVNGGLTELAYLPQDSLGYAFMINSGSSDALYRIGELIKTFLTRNIEREVVIPPTIELTQEIRDYFDGYYLPINPRQEFGRFLEKIFGVLRVWSDEENISTRGVIFVGDKVDYKPISSNILINPTNGLSHMALVEDPLEGTVLHIGTRVLRPVSLFTVIFQSGVFIGWAILSLLSLLYGLIWGVQYWKGMLQKGPDLSLRIWSLATSLVLLISVILIGYGVGDAFKLLAAPTFVSVSIMLLTLLYAVMATWTMVHVIHERTKAQNRVLFWLAAISASLHFLVVIYLSWFGVIGTMTWT